MKIKNPELWERVKKASFISSDPTAVLRVALCEAWANEMEATWPFNYDGIQQAFKTVYAYPAFEYTTGCHAALVALLGECWEHGDALRFMHNAAMGLRNTKADAAPFHWTLTQDGAVVPPPGAMIGNEEYLGV